MAKKNLKESVLRYEIQINLDNVLDVLGKLNFINISIIHIINSTSKVRF